MISAQYGNFVITCKGRFSNQGFLKFRVPDFSYVFKCYELRCTAVDAH